MITVYTKEILSAVNDRAIESGFESNTRTKPFMIYGAGRKITKGSADYFNSSCLNHEWKGSCCSAASHQFIEVSFLL